MLFWIAMTVGCGETSPDTLVDELRVIASVATPPEVNPNEPFSLESYLANPEEDAVETLTWVCTNLGDGCLESSGGAISLHRSTSSDAASQWERQLSVSPALVPLLAEAETLTATQLWTLVCTEGTCPIISDVGASDGMGGWPDGVHDSLANPTDWLSDLPVEGVSIAYQLLTTSLSDEPHQNPTIDPAEDNPDELTKGESFALTFTVDGDFTDQAQLYSYISAGGFMNLNTFVNPGDSVTVEGTSPKSGETVQLWMVITDGNGGIGVWTSTLSLV